MYAIIEIKGKQYKVESEEIFQVDHIQMDPGSDFTDYKVLLYKNEDQVLVGKPYLDDIKIILKVVDAVKGKKIIVGKHNTRTSYRRRYGHRQLYTHLQVGAIH